MSHPFQQELPPELPQRIRKNKWLPPLLSIVVILVIGFLVFSRTRTYQIYHHRTAMRTLGGTFITPATWDWKAYLSPQVFIWLMSYNLTLQEKMESSHRHMEELIALGYLERRVFKLKRPLDQNKDAVKQLEAYPGELWTPETIVGVGKDGLLVVAPAEMGPKWQEVVARWESAGRLQQLQQTEGITPEQEGKRGGE